jgi:hypothetical protein
MELKNIINTPYTIAGVLLTIAAILLISSMF